MKLRPAGLARFSPDSLWIFGSPVPSFFSFCYPVPPRIVPSHPFLPLSFCFFARSFCPYERTYTSNVYPGGTEIQPMGIAFDFALFASALFIPVLRCFRATKWVYLLPVALFSAAHLKGLISREVLYVVRPIKIFGPFYGQIIYTYFCSAKATECVISLRFVYLVCCRKQFALELNDVLPSNCVLHLHG